MSCYLSVVNVVYFLVFMFSIYSYSSPTHERDDADDDAVHVAEDANADDDAADVEDDDYNDDSSTC